MDALQPPTKTERGPGIKIVNHDMDLFPFEVHPVVEEEAVEPFELGKLGFREVLSYEIPNFRGQIREVGHRRLRVENQEIRYLMISGPLVPIQIQTGTEEGQNVDLKREIVIKYDRTEGNYYILLLLVSNNRRALKQMHKI